MQYVIGAVVLVVLLWAFLHTNTPGARKRRVMSVDQLNDTLNKAEGARISGKLDDAVYLYSLALDNARNAQVHVLVAESYYGLAKVQEDRKLYREAVHMLDLAIRAIEPVKRDFDNYFQLLTRVKSELSARIPS